MHCDVLLRDAFYLLLGWPWLFDNVVIYGGPINTYSLMHNRCNLTLAILPAPKPLIIKLGTQRKKVLYKSETKDECGTSKSKPQIVLLMDTPNISEKVNPLCPMTSMSSHASGVEYMHKLTSGNPWPCKLSSWEKLNEHGQPMDGISFGPNGINL